MTSPASLASVLHSLSEWSLYTTFPPAVEELVPDSVALSLTLEQGGFVLDLGAFEDGDFFAFS